MTTSPCFRPPTVESLFRRHLAEMRTYATEIESVLGKKSPIVKRIKSCAASNEEALTRLLAAQPEQAA